MSLLYCQRKDNIYAVPVLHYTMELAAHVRGLFLELKPDCVAVELPESLNQLFLRAAGRLPDISVVQVDSLYYMAEPCDASFEAVRSALEAGSACYGIDLDVEDYPHYREPLPDPYAIVHIGLEKYYTAYLQTGFFTLRPRSALDHMREIYMARRLKELSLRYEKVLFVCGFSHMQPVLDFVDQSCFPDLQPVPRQISQLLTLTEEAMRNGMGEYGWITMGYEKWRETPSAYDSPMPDRQQLLYQLYKTAAQQYRKNTGNSFLHYHLRTLMKFVRNLSLVHQRLMPDLFDLLTAAKGCVDHNYAYETWALATAYSHLKNIDNLEAVNLTAEEIWGQSKLIRFHLKQKQRKGLEFQARKSEGVGFPFEPPPFFHICSYPPEDVVVENFGKFLKKKGSVHLGEERAHSIPFTTHLEEGIDMRETIRHLYTQKLYVKVKSPPTAEAGSIVVIFDEDSREEVDPSFEEKYPWKATWHGEHTQESDMAFYATSIQRQVVGPGISRCEYGGFMMSYPPRRLNDIWNDPDYVAAPNKAEHLLMASLDYALKPVVVYVARKPPHPRVKRFASHFGKKIAYLPLSQISPLMLNRIRVFHVLGGYDKRKIAGDYIF